jgi:hypothetical protein
VSASYAKALVEALKDPEAQVRLAAHDALVNLNGGVDLGPADDPAAVAKWAESFK